MTPEIDLDAIRARLLNATEGPWAIWPDLRPEGLITIDDATGVIPEGETWTDGPSNTVAHVYTKEDAEFIRHAPADVAALLSALTAKTAELERMKRDAAQDTTIDERDEYHEVADKLAEAIAAVAGIDIGEHSNMNDPWANALEAMPKLAAELAEAKGEEERYRQEARDSARMAGKALRERGAARAELETARVYGGDVARQLAAARAELERLRSTNGCPSCAAGGCDEFIHLPAPGVEVIQQLGELQRDLNDVQFQLGQTRAELEQTRAQLADAAELLHTIWYGTVNAPARERWLRLMAKPADASQPDEDAPAAVWCNRCLVLVGAAQLDEHNARPSHLALKPRPLRMAAGAGDGEQDTATASANSGAASSKLGSAAVPAAADNAAGGAA